MTVGKAKTAQAPAPDKTPNASSTLKEDTDVLQLQLLYDLKAQMDQMQAKLDKIEQK